MVIVWVWFEPLEGPDEVKVCESVFEELGLLQLAINRAPREAAAISRLAFKKFLLFMLLSLKKFATGRAGRFKTSGIY